MKVNDMIEQFQKTIEEIFINTWKHEGNVDQTYGDAIDFEIDNKHYCLTLKCMEEKNEK
jgi:hypothetical protein